MPVVVTLWYFFQLWVAIYLVLPFLLLVVYLARKWTRTQFSIDRKKTIHTKDFDFAVVITAHQDLTLVPALADSLIKQRYERFLIYIVADACAPGATRNLPRHPRIVVLEPAAPLHAKIRSIDLAISNFQRPHDALVILDSDNLVHPQFLPVMNRYFQKGFRAVQGNLQPKNADNLFARLDAIGDAFYNFVEREARMELNLSSAIWGSGIAIETELYRETVYDSMLGGFDKRIQADLVSKIPQLAFAKEAILYDEKVGSAASLEKQRTRWIYAHFRYLGLGWKTFMLGLRRGNANLMFFGFVNLRPPLFLVTGCGFLLTLLAWWHSGWLFTSWVAVMLLFICSFITIVSMRVGNKRLVWSVFFLPLFVWRQFTALVRLRQARRTFMKTEHSKLIYIEDLLKNEPA